MDSKVRSIDDFILWAIRHEPLSVMTISSKLQIFGFEEEEIIKAAQELIKNSKVKLNNNMKCYIP